MPPATKKSCHLLNSVRALECGCGVEDSCLSFAPATLQREGTMQREDGHGGISARGCRKLKLAATKGGVQRLAGRSESNTRNTRPDCERKLACSVGDNQDHTLTGHAELLDGLGSTNHPWVECQLSLAQSLYVEPASYKQSAACCCCVRTTWCTEPQCAAIVGPSATEHRGSRWRSASRTFTPLRSVGGE